MGLDMYLEGEKYYWHGAGREEDGLRVKTVRVELGYWRKHPNLHGFIVQAFAEGNDYQAEIRLDATALRNIISAVKEKRLPHTEGFFFGRSSGDDAEVKEDIEILERALAWVEAGDKKPEPPIERPMGGGMVMVKIEPGAFAGVKETREVIYRASW